MGKSTQRVKKEATTPQVQFVKELAKYLAGDQVEMSLKLQLQRPEAKRWSSIRSTTPLFGYPTVDEAEQTLAQFLGIEVPRE